MRISASTRLMALVGDPVAHSFSPAMQNAGIRAAGLDAVYVALRCSADDAGRLVIGIAHAGGGGNVTVPHKRRVAAVLQRATTAVTRTGACNTYWLEQGRVCGDNTDVAGFQAAANTLFGSLADTRVLIVGAGGAARAAVVALLTANAAQVTILNRSRDRADALVRDLQTSPTRLLTLHDAARIEGEFDLVVNATPLGLGEDATLPVDLTRIPGVGAALDMVALPGGTPWTRHARRLGIPTADGTEMLLAQGAAAFERWFGQPAPIAAMRASLHAAMREASPNHGELQEVPRA